MTNAKSDFAKITQLKLQEIKAANEPLDPLARENQDNMEAKANWPFNKENNEFISSKSEKDRIANAQRQRRFYQRKREKEGKPYIPIIDRMKGREACEQMGYSQWRADSETNKPREFVEDEQLEKLREKIARLEAQRDGVSTSILDAKKKIQIHKQHLKGVLALNYSTILACIEVKYATYTELKISLGNIHDFFQKRST